MAKQPFSCFTLIELLLVIALIGLLAALLLPALNEARQRAKVVRAVVELRSILQILEIYRGEHNEHLPPQLSAVIDRPMKDPWGNPYVYANFATIEKGARRKDKNLVPINSEFDLYSKGPDGLSVAPLTAPRSRDDVIVADDGHYIGLAEYY